jgi:hypothetical protein
VPARLRSEHRVQAHFFPKLDPTSDLRGGSGTYPMGIRHLNRRVAGMNGSAVLEDSSANRCIENE